MLRGTTSSLSFNSRQGPYTPPSPKSPVAAPSGGTGVSKTGAVSITPSNSTTTTTSSSRNSSSNNFQSSNTTKTSAFSNPWLGAKTNANITTLLSSKSLNVRNAIPAPNAPIPANVINNSPTPYNLTSSGGGGGGGFQLPDGTVVNPTAQPEGIGAKLAAMSLPAKLAIGAGAVALLYIGYRVYKGGGSATAPKSL